MFCTKCGEQIPDRSIFCLKCGNRIVVSQEQAPKEEPMRTNAEAFAADRTDLSRDQMQADGNAAPNALPEQDDGESRTIAIVPGVNDPAPVSLQKNAQAGEPYIGFQGNPQVGALYGNYAQEHVQTGVHCGAVRGNVQMGTPYEAAQGNAQLGAAFEAIQRNVQSGIPYTSSPFGPAPQVCKPPKKRFMMPLAVNIILGVLAVMAAAVCACVVILGENREIERQEATNRMVSVAENPKAAQTEIREYDLSGETLSLEIPETEESVKAREMADSYIIADSDSRYLEYDELSAFTEEELFYAGFEIFARAGLDLGEIDSELGAFFEAKSWYEPSISYNDVEDLSDFLNEYEIANLELLEEYLGAEYGYY